MSISTEIPGPGSAGLHENDTVKLIAKEALTPICCTSVVVTKYDKIPGLDTGPVTGVPMGETMEKLPESTDDAVTNSPAQN